MPHLSVSMAILPVCTYRRSGASIRIQRAGVFGVPRGIPRCYEPGQDRVNVIVGPMSWDDSTDRKVRSFSGQNRIRNPGRYGARAKGDLATADREKPGALRPDARPFRERYAGRRPAGALPEHETSVRAHECPARIGHARLHCHVVPDTTALRLLLRYPRPALVRAGHAHVGRALLRMLWIRHELPGLHRACRTGRNRVRRLPPAGSFERGGSLQG